jgi:hypothetical protein
MPAGERTFEAVLNEIVGALSVAAQQRQSEQSQPRDLGFEEFDRALGCFPQRRRAAIHGVPRIPNLSVADEARTAEVIQAMTDRRPGNLGIPLLFIK